jgi:cytochrome c oxidase assembly factor 4
MKFGFFVGIFGERIFSIAALPAYLKKMRVQVRSLNGSPESDDLQDRLVEKTGCKELNDAVLICFYDKKDWRACQQEVLAFKTCFEAYQARIKEKEGSNL